MVDESPSRSLDKFVLRLPDGMRESLATRAKVNGRSMNAEITAILSAALDPSAAELAELREELKAVMRQRDEAAGAMEGIERRMYVLVDRVQDLQKALGIEETINEEDL